MNNVEKTIYDLLKGGLDADTLTKALNDAQKQIDKEAKEKAEARRKAEEEAKRRRAEAERKAKRLDDARHKVAEATFDYYKALGVIELKDTINKDETISKIEKEMISFEKLIDGDWLFNIRL